MTVVLAYCIGNASARHVRRGGGGPSCWGCAMSMLCTAHYATVDVFLTFMFTLALYRCVLVVDKPSYRNMLVAGLAAGLSMAVKFNGVFAVVAVVLSSICLDNETALF